MDQDQTRPATVPAQPPAGAVASAEPAKSADQAPLRGRRRIALCGLPFSPNVGDGVISDCLAHVIAKVAPEAEVVRIDLAGRQDFVAGQPGRMLFMKVAKRLPGFARQRLVQAILGYKMRTQLAPRWRAQLQGVDGVIIGGGQLLDDVDLNFPIKISGFVACLNQLNLPFTIACVGVSRNWSAAGRALFERVLCSPLLRLILVRDAASMSALISQVPPQKMPPRAIVPDPGVVSDEVYGSVAEPGTSRSIGINIADPINLGYSGSVSDGLTAEAWLAVYAQLVAVVEAAGFTPVFFTNGAFEDDVYCQTVVQHLASHGKTIRAQPRPGTPQALADAIREHRLIVSPRLHACIVAEALGIASIAMGPVRKLEAFYHTLQMPLRLLTSAALKRDGEAAIRTVIDQALGADNRAAIAVGRARVEAGVRDLLLAMTPAEVSAHHMTPAEVSVGPMTPAEPAAGQALPTAPVADRAAISVTH